VYTWSPDQDFIIDELPGSGGSLWVGCGFSGHGFKLAPIVGKMLSEMTLKGKHPYPRAKKHFSIERLGIKWGMTTYRTDKSKL
jgi:sarcosine oxidase/L-pipecolate oxidase